MSRPLFKIRSTAGGIRVQAPAGHNVYRMTVAQKPSPRGAACSAWASDISPRWGLGPFKPAGYKHRVPPGLSTAAASVSLRGNRWKVNRAALVREAMR